MLKLYFVVAVVFVWSAASSQGGTAVFAGRAASVDNAEPDPVGQLDVETEFNYSKLRTTDSFEIPLTLTYGLLPRLEVSASMGAQLDDRVRTNQIHQTVGGSSDLSLSAKLKLVDQEQAWATHAVALLVKFPTANRGQDLGTGYFDYDVTWLASKDFTDRLSADFNFGYTWIGNGAAVIDSLPVASGDIFHCGVGSQYQFTKQWSLGAELFSSIPLNSQAIQAGAATGTVSWQLSPQWTVAGSVTTGLWGETGNTTVAVGVTRTFGRPLETSPKSD